MAVRDELVPLAPQSYQSWTALATTPHSDQETIPDVVTCCSPSAIGQASSTWTAWSDGSVVTRAGWTHDLERVPDLVELVASIGRTAGCEEPTGSSG